MQRRPTTDEPTASTAPVGGARTKKLALAKRGLKSLVVAVAVPPLITAATAHVLGGPQTWVVTLMGLSSSLLMGLAAWLVWAEGGFRRRPAALWLYVAALAMSLVWGPLVFGAGSARAGLAVCAGLFLALVGCARVFKECNSVAGDLVKPCLAWACFLAIYSYRLL